MRVWTAALIWMWFLPLWAAPQQPAAPRPAAPQASSAPVTSHKELERRYPPLKEIQIPEVQTHTLSNGMRLYLLEDHSLPTISGQALIRTGNLFDPRDKIGLAEITGAVLRTGGAISKTGDQLDQELESMAASVEVGIGETSGQASFFALKEHVDKVLAIYADVLIRPAFRQDKIDLYKNQTRSAIARRNDDPVEIARRELGNLIYGRDNPYGWQQEYEHVDRIERADLEQFYRRYVFPANILLAVYGDFRAAEMKAKIEAIFQPWTAKQAPAPPFPAVKAPRKGGVYLVAKDDVNQSNLRLGHLGGLLKDEDYPALQVMGDILGGGFPSRLFREVRTRLGFAYSVGAAWSASYNHPGLFLASAGTKSSSTIQAAKAVLAEIDRLRQSEVTEAELATAKQSVLNSFVFNFDTRAKTLGRLMTYEYWGYPKDFIFQYKKKLEGVTRQDVLRVAQKYLRPEELVLVAVGKPADFDQPLASLGKPVTPLDITIPQPKQERVQADAQSLALGRAALERAQKAAGGAEKLAAIKDLTASVKAQIRAPMGSMAIQQRLRIVLPSVLRQDTELPFGKIVVYTDGKAGWMQGPQGQMPLPAAQLQQARGEMFRINETLLLSDRDPARAINWVKKAKVGEREADVIEISAKDGPQVRLFIDAASGQLLKKEYRGEALAGAPAQVEELYEDFREVSGLRVPFKTVIWQNEKRFAENQITELQYNTGLKAEDLAKP